MSLTDDESYYCLGYANKKVKEEFKSYFRNFSTLEEAIDSLICLGESFLYNKYTFMDNDVKYRLRAKASSLDNPEMLNEALLRWYSFVESSNYKSMGCVIEKLLMVRKQTIKKQYYAACEIIEKSKKLAEISPYPGMFDNHGNLQSSAKPFSKQDHDGKISKKDGNVQVVQNLPASKDDFSPSADFKNYKSTWSVEDQSEHFDLDSSTEDVVELFDGSKSEMVAKKSDESNLEEASNVEPVDESDSFIKNTSIKRNYDDLNIRNAMSNSKEVLDVSAVELISEKLKLFQLENDALIGENGVSSVESGHVPNELTVPSGTKTLVGESDCPNEGEKLDDCEESDSWGTTIEISSDTEASSEYKRYDNYY